MWIHRIVGCLMLILTIIFVGLEINKKKGYIDKENPHTLIGLTILTLVLIQFSLGFFSKSRLNSLKWKTIWIMRIKKLHRVNK